MKPLSLNARRCALAVAAIFAVIVIVVEAQRRELPASSERIVKIQDDIYVAQPTSGADSNVWIFINEDDVLIVDTHWTPARARTLAANVATLTSKPISHVIDTHYHTDHALGNQSFPGAQLIGHEYTRQMMFTRILEQKTHRYYTQENPANQIANLKKELTAATDPATREELEYRLLLQTTTLEKHGQEIKEAVPTPPFVTFKSEMTIHRGSREFQLHFLGRAHTGGDIVVFLPKERMIATGDFFGNGIGYMGDAWVNEWPDALEKLRGFAFDQVLPGHGQPFNRAAADTRISAAQGYYRGLWTQTVALRKQGLSPEQAALKVDLSEFKGTYPQAGVGVDSKAVARIYNVMDGKILPQ